MYAETPGFVRSSTHDRAVTLPSDDYGLAPQARIITLLDGSIERIHVDMEDFAHNLSPTILFRSPEHCERASGRIETYRKINETVAELSAWRTHKVFVIGGGSLVSSLVETNRVHPGLRTTLDLALLESSSMAGGLLYGAPTRKRRENKTQMLGSSRKPASDGAILLAAGRAPQ
jgi:hypothetical protein